MGELVYHSPLSLPDLPQLHSSGRQSPRKYLLSSSEERLQMLGVWKIPHQPRLPKLVWKINSLSHRQDRCGIFLIFHFPRWVLFVVRCLPTSSQLSVTGHNKDQRSFPSFPSLICYFTTEYQLGPLTARLGR